MSAIDVSAVGDLLLRELQVLSPPPHILRNDLAELHPPGERILVEYMTTEYSLQNHASACLARSCERVLVSTPADNVVTFVCEDGDPFDIDDVYRTHGNWLIAFLRRRFGQQDAEDLAQETYARAVSSGAEIRNPRAFLARVALNAARDQIRRRKARPVLVRDDASVVPIFEASQAETVLLKQAILALPPRLQQVFLLSRFGGLTYEEIARRCGISVKTVEKRMTKALAMCTALLQ